MSCAFVPRKIGVICVVGVWVAHGEEGAVHEIPEVVVEETAVSSYVPQTVVGATGTALPTSLSPQTVNVLTKELIEAVQADNLDELMVYDTSVSTGGASLYSRTSGKYSIRGYSGSDVSLQGLPLADGMGMMLDAALIDQVEVVRGPIGSLQGGQTSTLGPYGAGGAILLKLKQPTLEDLTETSLGVRLTESGGQRYRLTLDHNTVAWGEEGSFDFGSRTIVTGEYDRPFWLNGHSKGGQCYTIAPSFMWRDSKSRIALNMAFQYQDAPSYQGVPVLGGQFVGPYGIWLGSPNSRNEYKGALIQLNGEWELDSTWTVRAGAGTSFSDVDYNIWALSSGAPSRTISTLDYYNSIIATGKGYYEYAWADTVSVNWNAYGQALAKVKTGSVDHEVLIGLDYTARHKRGHSSFATTDQLFDIWTPEAPWATERDYGIDTKQSQTVHRTGVTLQELASWEQWKFLAGLRMDGHFSAEGNAAFSVSPRVGFSRSFEDRVVVFGNFSRTESPNFNYLDANDEEMTSSWNANQVEGGVRVNPWGSLWLSASAFMIEQNHSPELLPNDRTHYYDNGKSRSKGIELTLNGNITPAWSSYLSYTFLEYKDIDAGQSFDRYPPHAWALWQQYKIQGGWLSGTKLGVGYRFRASSLATIRGNKIADNYTIPSYHVFDCAVEIPLQANDYIPESSIRFAVYNIFNERYVASSRHAVQCFAGEPRTFEICWKSKF